jgi:Rrf2 family protein
MKKVNADLIASVPGVKGGFKLKKNAAEIRMYDVYLAIEGQQSLYSPNGILDDMLELEKEDRCCLLTDLMDEAENAWKSVLKRETMASLYDETKNRFPEKVDDLKEWIKGKMVI